MQLYNGGQDVAFITMIGLNFSTFHELLAIFSSIFHEYNLMLIQVVAKVSFHIITIGEGEDKPLMQPLLYL